MSWFLFHSRRVGVTICALVLVFLPTWAGGLSAMDVPGDADPGLALRPPTLSADEEKVVRTWFKELGSEDFDAREAAMSKIVGKGPAVLAIAKDYFNDPDREIAMLAKGLRTRILLKFDGFLPPDSALTEALAKPSDPRAQWHQDDVGGIAPLLTIRDIGAKSGFKVEIDAVSVSPNFTFPAQGQMPPLAEYARSMPSCTQGELLQMLASYAQARGVARGDVFLITSPEAAQRLARQRYTFDWSALELSRDEAARAEKELAHFFPSSDTELHSGSTALLIGGPDEAILRAARLIGLLKPRSPDSIWPAPAPMDDAALLEKLSSVAPVQISTEDPLKIVAVLRKLNFDVAFFPPGANAPLPANAPGTVWNAGNGRWDMTSLNLNFSQRPAALGLILRWCERRGKVTHLQQSAALAFDVVGGSQPVLQARNALFPTTQPVGGADVSFLYKAPAEFSAETDAAVLKQLADALDSHLALYPAIEMPGRMRVFRGRLIVQGPDATLRRIIVLVNAWRASGTPPAPAQWRAEMDAALGTQLEWDGRGLTGGKLLTILRRNGKVPIFLEDGPASAANFELTQKDAELFAPGKYTLKELLDELTLRAKAQWRVDLGAIVLTPK